MEAAMWAWYLEWSQIARVAIKQRSLLKELGFLAARRGGEDDNEGDSATSPGGPASTPAPTAGAGIVATAAIARAS